MAHADRVAFRGSVYRLNTDDPAVCITVPVIHPDTRSGYTRTVAGSGRDTELIHTHSRKFTVEEVVLGLRLD